jgi:hypothetical protein
MRKSEYVGRLDHAASEFRGTIRNWKGRVDLQTAIGPLVSQLEQISKDISASKESIVGPDTAGRVWQVMDAIDKGAKSTGNADVERDIHVGTTSVRQFYLSRGAELSADGKTMTFRQR